MPQFVVPEGHLSKDVCVIIISMLLQLLLDLSKDVCVFNSCEAVCVFDSCEAVCVFDSCVC